MERQSNIKPCTTYYNTNYQYSAIQKYQDGDKMHGIRRVLTFCLLTTVLPSILIIIPLYLRNVKYADVMYIVSDSDVIQIHQGQSSIFCKAHYLKMNSTFNAFQMRGEPDISTKTKHIKLKKSMTLPDDTLEYWGFYLMKGATVELKACSRYDGSKILVVKGERVLDTCDILNDNKKVQTKLANNEGNVVITLESPEKNTSKIDEAEEENNAQEIIDDDDDLQELLQIQNTLQDKIVQKKSYNISSLIDPVITLDNRLNEVDSRLSKKFRRDVKMHALHKPNTVLDTGVHHGGNAVNGTIHHGDDSSVSSFENSLHQCYSGNILINELFPFAEQCKSTHYLEMTTTLKIIHEVTHDGYYYYIFYSDNDIVQNDIHAIFDIYKPTFQYSNLPASKMCINGTECHFEVDFLSDELVIVEVPTKDGIEHHEDDSSILISTCDPRMSVYIFFPVTVILLILLFAFL